MERRPVSLRSARLIWIVSLAFVAVVVSFAEFLGGASGNQLGWSQLTVAAMGIWSAWSGYSLRRKLMLRATTAMSEGAADAGGRKWSAAQLIGIASAVGVVLWGFVADVILKCPRLLGGVLYVAGVVILVLYRPTNPPITASS